MSTGRGLREARGCPCRDGPFGDLKVPLTWTAAAALVVATIIAAGAPAQRPARDAARPAPTTRAPRRSTRWPRRSAACSPPRCAGSTAASTAVRGYFFAVSENRTLKAELRRAAPLARRSDRAGATGERPLRRPLLGLKTDPPIPHGGGRIDLRRARAVRQHPPGQRRPRAGRHAIGNPVMTEHGLVGRVVGVSDQRQPHPAAHRRREPRAGDPDRPHQRAGPS